MECLDFTDFVNADVEVFDDAGEAAEGLVGSGARVIYTTLVDVAALKAHLADPNWRVVDVRHQLADVNYGRARLPPVTFQVPCSCTAIAIFQGQRREITAAIPSCSASAD